MNSSFQPILHFRARELALFGDVFPSEEMPFPGLTVSNEARYSWVLPLRPVNPLRWPVFTVLPGRSWG